MLVIALVVQTVLFFAVQRDVSAVDPLLYAHSAHDLAFHLSTVDRALDTVVFGMRLGITAPLALMYRVFGVSTLVTNLPGLFAGLGIVAIAYAAAATPRAKLLAVMFAIACTPLLVDGRELTPDLPCAAVMAASILCLSRRDRPRGARWVAGAVVVWFAAFQIKEVAVWCAPVWIYAVIRDLRDHGGRWVVQTFGPATCVGAGLAAGYLAFCAVFWGNPLARFAAIQAVASFHGWSLVGHPRAEWVARLTWQPPELLFRLFGAALVPVVVSPWLVRGRDRIWVVAVAVIILMFWFGSTNTATYMPLPPHRRMLLPALPFLIVVSALATDAAFDRIRSSRWRLGIALALAVGLVVPHVNSLRRKLFAGCPEQAAYAALRAEVASTTDRILLVCGDYRCPTSVKFYFGFDMPANLSVITVPDFVAAAPPGQARVRLIVNSQRSLGNAIEVAQHAEALGLRRIVGDPAVGLYDADNGARLREALAAPR